MYAVIAEGGKQYRIAEGDTIRVEKMNSEEGAAVSFDKVLMVKGDDGAIAVGTPYLEGRRVTGTVVSCGRAGKIRVIKFKRRKNYKRCIGHRQSYTEVRITAIE